MTRLLQTKWMAIALGTVVYLVMTWLFLQPKKQVALMAKRARAAEQARPAVSVGPSWNFENPEMDTLIAQLKEQREALQTRSAQLSEWEARLNAERQEIYSVTQAAFQLKTNIEATMTHITDEEAVNLKKLVKVYSTMSPEGAAHILEEMDDDQIVKILALMKEPVSAPIIENLGQGTKDAAKRAAMISDRLRLTIAPATQKKAQAP